MYDTAVLRPSGARDSSAIARRRPGGQRADRADDDDLLAQILITSWTLATGRTWPAGVAPQSLTDDELISFWADEQTASASGAISGPDRAADAR